MLDANILKSTSAEYEAGVKKQQALEKAGQFNEDLGESTFGVCLPVDENFDYLKRGFINRIKHWFYLSAMKRYSKKINRELTNLKVVGRENLAGIKTGCIVTCNHISKVDSFAVRAAVGMDLKFVGAEFNNWEGILGDISRHTGFMPIPTQKIDLKVMRKFNQALEYFLQHKWPILIYPEQAMWDEYKKPRPLKRGAFHYAAKYQRPVVPLFITIVDKPERFDDKGLANFGDYTIHILPPIYPNPELNERENAEAMLNANFEAWRNCYEQTYGVPLQYDTVVTPDTDPLVKKYAQSSNNKQSREQNAKIS